MTRLKRHQQRSIATLLFAFLLTGTAAVGHAWEAGALSCRMLVVASSQEKFPLMQEFQSLYNAAGRSLAGQCMRVSVEQVNSGDAELALETGWDSTLGARPDVWSPASTAWLALLEQRTPGGTQVIIPGQASSLFRSPLVIAMPLPMAAALGYPAKQLGWSELLALARNPRGWASVPAADPAWGAFKLGKTNPTVSTSGLHALLGTYFAASGGNLTAQSVADPKVRDFVAGIEASVVHYGPTAKTFLTNLNVADNQGNALSYVSAIAVEEEELINYNLGRYDPNGVAPAMPLVAIYPREGTPVADHPYAVLRSSRNQAAAADFLEFLGEARQQKRIQAEGFRSNLNQLADSVVAGDQYIQAKPPEADLDTNTGAILEVILGQWRAIRKHARVLIVVDVARGDTPRQGIGWATQPMISAIGRFDPGGPGDPGDQVGLWTFPGSSGPYDASAFTAPPGLLTKTLSGIKASSASGDVDAVLELAVAAMTATYEPSRIDAILLVTGSRSGLQTADLKLERLLRNQHVDQFVKVFVVGPPDLGKPAHDRLMGIARAGRGALYEPASTRTVLAEVVSNF
jgi:Ca-activated chloride channel homolog